MRKMYVLSASLIGVIGIMMLIAPDKCIQVAVIALGIFALVNGFFTLAVLRPLVAEQVYQRTMIVRGIVSILVGALAVSLPLFLAGLIWTIMVYTIAVYLFLSASVEIYGIQKLKDTGKNTKPYKIEIIASCILAVILFCIPTKIGETLIRIGGVLLLIACASCLYAEWKNKPLTIEAEILNDDNEA